MDAMLAYELERMMADEPRELKRNHKPAALVGMVTGSWVERAVHPHYVRIVNAATYPPTYRCLTCGLHPCTVDHRPLKTFAVGTPPPRSRPICTNCRAALHQCECE